MASSGSFEFGISDTAPRYPVVGARVRARDAEWLKRALAQPRVRLLIADDVGLGKTLEAGLVTAELLVRRKADRILVVTTKTMLAQFQREFWSRFSIPLVRLDSAAIRRARNAIPTNHNPFDQFDKAIISVDTLKNDGQYRTALENAYWDLIIIDEAHNVAARRATSGSRSLRATVARLLADRADSLLLLTATPHDGSARSFNSLIQMLDPTAVADPDEVSRDEVSQFLVRRFRTTPDVQAELKSKIPPREVRRIDFDLTPAEEKAYKSVAELELDADVEARAQGRRSGNELFRTTIAKALFSSPAACIETIDNRLRRIKQGEVAGTARDAERLRSLRDDIVAVGTDDFTKYQNLLAHLKNLKWTGKDKRDRLLIFSERIASLKWLEKRLQSDYPKLADKGIVVLDGSGVGSDLRAQEIVEEFENENSPIRILLASDIASEGLNLHFQCHRLFHFDLPWALLTFQQRNGRIDRYGQDRQPIISYFVGCSSHPKVEEIGIAQLGSVYETLISFTGFIAREPLVEVQPIKASKKDDTDAEENDDTDDSEEDEDDDGEGEDGDEGTPGPAGSTRSLLDPAWFVPVSRFRPSEGTAPEITTEEVVYEGGRPRIYEKGRFVYRLAGRDRSNTASYYTPEPLARLLVKHALEELLRNKKADEILKMRVCEPAMGSAAFLVETVNQLADTYLDRKQKELRRIIPQDQYEIERQRVRAYIADRNCFGVDQNPTAVELGQVSLWLNCLHKGGFRRQDPVANAVQPPEAQGILPRIFQISDVSLDEFDQIIVVAIAQMFKNPLERGAPCFDPFAFNDHRTWTR